MPSTRAPSGVTGHPPVVVLGGINMDLVVPVPRLPRPGETVLGESLQRFGGGKGANQAVAAARMEASTHLIGRVGSDDFGSAILSALTADGIGLDGVLRDSETWTGVALIGVDAQGNNSIIVAAGANSRVGPTDLEAARTCFVQRCVLVANFEVPPAAVLAAAERVRAERGRVVLNLAPALPPPSSLLENVDVLVVNETEAAILAGQSAEPQELAMALLKRGPRSVVLTVGADGCWIADPDQVVHLPGHRVHVVDSTGAGDAFVGALAAELTRGAPLLFACTIANAAAALAVTQAGAQPSIPRRVEVVQFLQERNQSSDATANHHRY